MRQKVHINGDGFGDPAGSIGACDAPEGYIADGTDCDDTDAGRAPNAAAGDKHRELFTRYLRQGDSAISAEMPWPFGGISCSVKPRYSLAMGVTHSGR